MKPGKQGQSDVIEIMRIKRTLTFPIGDLPGIVDRDSKVPLSRI
jgi:hypothetical protein